MPAFGLTGEAALLDLETLECTPLRFANAVGTSGVEGSKDGGGGGTEGMEVEGVGGAAD